MDIDASSFNKSVNVDLLIQGDLSKILDMTIKFIKDKKVLLNQSLFPTGESNK